MGTSEIDGVAVDFKTHHHAHLDELLARIAIERYAGAEWVKAHAVGVLDGRQVIELGVGDGPFNEHARPGLQQTRKKGETAASLVFGSLNLKEFPLFKRLLEYAIPHDLEGRGTRHDLGNLLKAWTRVRVDQGRGTMNEVVYNWFAIAFEAALYVDLLRRSGVALPDRLKHVHHRPFSVRNLTSCIRLHRSDTVALAWRKQAAQIRLEARRGYLAACQDVIANSRVEPLTVGDKTITVCVYTGDSPYSLGAYRAEGGPGGDVFVQFQSTGHVFVAATRQSAIRLDWAVTILRSMIQSTRLKRGELTREQAQHRFRLRYEGTLPGTPEINFVRNERMRMIMNGSLTHPFTPAINGPKGLLNRRQVMYAVTEGLRKELTNEALPQRPERREPRGSYAKVLD